MAPTTPSSREEKFEFAQKPAIKKEGGKYVIVFALAAAGQEEEDQR